LQWSVIRPPAKVLCSDPVCLVAAIPKVAALFRRSTGVKIICLEAENIKRIVAVEIRPDGSLVQITGRNGQGKSSILDSIFWAISGARHIQSAPIRKGANQARIRLDMGEIIVQRHFKREKDGDGYTTKLEVVGAVKGSPQAMLDSLLDSLAFDPLQFARMDAKQQFETLKKYVGDFDFDKITAANSIDFAARAAKNKRAKEERVLADQIIIPEKAATVRIDETALVSELAKAGTVNADIERRRDQRQRMKEAIDANTREVSHLRQLADELEAKTKDLIEKLSAAPELPDVIDVAELQAQIKAARTANEQVALREKKALHEKAAERFEMEAKELTKRMDEREDQKRAAIAGAKIPVSSITLGDGVVLLNGVPFEQGSDAEQLRASCELAMAGNPQLRVIRVRDGSLLDEDSLKLLATIAQERDYQVWIERVSNGEKIGFVIEDGRVVAEETANLFEGQEAK
jgi:hypothetical protein